ncbi:MAG: hypothetical protein JSS62_03025 [Verrucomicrobia bacterium]|nr:hypothetical protein [Verrucomicrobiota bacterium]MBS0646029.1 hypothetical protein [Verrucomicrobiota bacterium]
MENVEQKNRLEVLMSVIRHYKPSNQMQILKILKDEYQIDANQAMISRDLKKLGVVMKQEEGRRVYVLPNKDTEMQMLQLAVTNVCHNETMIVVSTTAGTAPFVGDLIDRSHLDILGCIAGENTIFVIPVSIKNIKKVFKSLCEALYYI